jgi:hypothetical protein
MTRKKARRLSQEVTETSGRARSRARRFLLGRPKKDRSLPQALNGQQ